MTEPPTPELAREREELIAEINAAFAGVTREGGVSWSESEVRDHYGTIEERARARARDQERSWEELVDDPAWHPDPGVGGLSFVDPIGFRYYVPAAMTRYLRGEGEFSLASYLTLRDEFREHTLGTWSLLDARQRACVRRFLRHVLAVEEPPVDPEARPGWWDPAFEAEGYPWQPEWGHAPPTFEARVVREALESYWERFDE